MGPGFAEQRDQHRHEIVESGDATERRGDGAIGVMSNAEDIERRRDTVRGDSGRAPLTGRSLGQRAHALHRHRKRRQSFRTNERDGGSDQNDSPAAGAHARMGTPTIPQRLPKQRFAPRVPFLVVELEQGCPHRGVQVGNVYKRVEGVGKGRDNVETGVAQSLRNVFVAADDNTHQRMVTMAAWQVSRSI